MQKVKTLAVIMVAGMGIMLLSGCASGWMEYQKRTVSPNVNSVSVTRYVSEDYEVLGTVTARGESQSILGIVVEGKEGQALLIEAAQAKYGDKCTGIKDISAYKEYKAILPIIYNEIKTTYIGTAVQE